MRYSITADLKVMFRIPIALFFNLFFPIFISTIMIGLIGNIDIGNGLKFADKYFLIGLGYGLAPLALISLPIAISDMFNSGILERYYLFNLDLKKVICSQLIVYYILSICQFLIIYGYLELVFSLTFNLHQMVSILLIYSVTSLSMIMLGVTIGLLLPNKESAQSIGLILMFLTLFLMGGFGDLDRLPALFTTLASLLSINVLTQDVLVALYDGQNLSNISLMVPAIYILVLGLINLVLIRIKFKTI